MKRLRATAWLLSILILFYAIPTSVYSLFIPDGESTADRLESRIGAGDPSSPSESTALGELEELRTPTA